MKTLIEPKILNVGCGNQMYGTDRVDIIKTKATTKVYDIRKGLPYPDNHFDFVWCSYVFEHMGNPMALLKEMKRVCKPNGRITIVTDNAGYILTNIKWRGLHGDYSDKAVHGSNYNAADYHLMMYTPEHLRNFAKSCDLKPLKYDYMFWQEVKSIKSKALHGLLRMFIGKRFALPSVYLIAEKKE